jgi:ribose transport system substrate-binding protein
VRELSVRIVFISLWVVAAALLLALFTQSSNGKSRGKIYNISVIMRDPCDRFMKGMDQAALEFNADLHILSGYAKNDGAAQLEYLMREISSTDAVVLYPEDVSQMEEYLAGLRQRPPIVTAIQPLNSSKLSIHVGADDSALGKALGEWILSSGQSECLILCPAEMSPIHVKRKNALVDLLEEARISYDVRYSKPDAQSVRQVLSITPVVASIDESLLVPLCLAASLDATLFGIGYEAGARQYLESGRLKGLAVYSEYDAGYLSLRAAVLAAEKNSPGDSTIDVYKASSENMYAAPVVNLLFPVG